MCIIHRLLGEYPPDVVEDESTGAGFCSWSSSVTPRLCAVRVRGHRRVLVVMDGRKSELQTDLCFHHDRLLAFYLICFIVFLCVYVLCRIIYKLSDCLPVSCLCSGFVRARQQLYLIEPLAQSADGDHAVYRQENLKTGGRPGSNTTGLYDQDKEQSPQPAGLFRSRSWVGDGRSRKSVVLLK